MTLTESDDEIDRTSIGIGIGIGIGLGIGLEIGLGALRKDTQSIIEDLDYELGIRWSSSSLDRSSHFQDTPNLPDYSVLNVNECFLIVIPITSLSLTLILSIFKEPHGNVSSRISSINSIN